MERGRARLLDLLVARAFRLEASVQLDMALHHDGHVEWMAMFLRGRALDSAIHFERIAAYVEAGRLKFFDEVSS